MANVGTAASGKTLIGAGNGSSPTYASIGTNSGLTAHGVVVAEGNGAFVATSVGSIGQVLTSNGPGVDPSFQTISTGGFNPNAVVNIFDDFVGTGYNSIQFQLSWYSLGFNNYLSVSGADPNHPGLIANTGNTESYLLLSTSTPDANGQFALGQGAISINWVIKVAVLSDITNTYTLRIGLGDTVSADQVNGVYFEYTDSLNSGNWVGKTSSASTQTSANSSIPVVDTDYVNLGITINADATSASFFVNGVQIANSPITTNIPTAGVFPFIDIVPSAGSIPQSALFVDLFYLSQTLTNPR